MEALPRIAAVALGVSLSICFVIAAPTLNTTFKNIDCPGDANNGCDYAACMDHIFAAMTTITGDAFSYYYNIRCPFAVTPVAYCESRCKHLLKIADCVTCLSTAKSFIKEKCPNVTSVRMELEDCSMSYGPKLI